MISQKRIIISIFSWNKKNWYYVCFFREIKCLFMFPLSRYNYPHHKIDRDVWWYYMIELSFYWSLCISQFFDVKRKDFWEMFIHHVTTIALMAFSWTCNLTRVGTLVLVIHDCADIFLEVTHHPFSQKTILEWFHEKKNIIMSKVFFMGALWFIVNALLRLTLPGNIFFSWNH